ncbi:MAG: hypothetical protein VW873_03500, partial [Betaproteobacteria bacterium]
QSAPFDRSGTPPNEAEHYEFFVILCQSLAYGNRATFRALGSLQIYTVNWINMLTSSERN